MAAVDGKYEIQIYQSIQSGNQKKLFTYVLNKHDEFKDTQLTHLKREMAEKFHSYLIFTETFNWPSSDKLKITLELAEYPPCTEQIDRRKVDAMSFGENREFIMPNNATVLKAIITDENDTPLLNKPVNAKLDCSHESRPGVEGDDTIAPVHQYMCMMLIVYTLYTNFRMQQPYFPGAVEGDDTIEQVHQYMCMMLIVYTLYTNFRMQQPYFR